MIQRIGTLGLAAAAIVAAVMLSGADAPGWSPGSFRSPEDYLDKSGCLKCPLRLECQAVGDAKAADVRARLGANMVMTIARDGLWTCTGSVGAGISGEGAAAIRGKRIGRLDKAGLRSVAAILHDNDLEGLRSYTYARRQRADDTAVIGYQVTIVFGNRKYCCFLRDVARARQPSVPKDAANRPAAELPRKEVPERFQDICLRLLAIAGESP